MNELKETKRVVWDIEVDLDKDVVEKLKIKALDWIKEDTQALVSYAASRILREKFEEEEQDDPSD